MGYSTTKGASEHTDNISEREKQETAIVDYNMEEMTLQEFK